MKKLIMVVVTVVATMMACQQDEWQEIEGTYCEGWWEESTCGFDGSHSVYFCEGEYPDYTWVKRSTEEVLGEHNDYLISMGKEPHLADVPLCRKSPDDQWIIIYDENDPDTVLWQYITRY